MTFGRSMGASAFASTWSDGGGHGSVVSGDGHRIPMARVTRRSWRPRRSGLEETIRRRERARELVEELRAEAERLLRE